MIPRSIASSWVPAKTACAIAPRSSANIAYLLRSPARAHASRVPCQSTRRYAAHRQPRRFRRPLFLTTHRRPLTAALEENDTARPEGSLRDRSFMWMSQTRASREKAGSPDTRSTHRGDPRQAWAAAQGHQDPDRAPAVSRARGGGCAVCRWSRSFAPADRRNRGWRTRSGRQLRLFLSLSAHAAGPASWPTVSTSTCGTRHRDWRRRGGGAATLFYVLFQSLRVPRSRYHRPPYMLQPRDPQLRLA
jgi:hypothetical protein